jgi:FkbM family methyltransferase
VSVTGHIIRLMKPLAEHFPRVATTYRLLRDSRYLPGEPSLTPMGFKFIGNRRMEEGIYESDVVEIVSRCFEKVDVFVNIGANIGYYCCIALSRSKHTVAFEPIELNLRYLYKNIRANNWENGIEIFPIALSNRVGLIEMYGGGTGASLVKGWAGTPEHYVRLVATSTLDTVIGKRLNGKRCFILADIEGGEQRMLEGARQMLAAEPKPIWMLEVSVAEAKYSGMEVNPNLLTTFEMFWENGYEAWTANRQPRRVGLDELEDISETGRDTLRTHNFLFIEAGRKRELLDAKPRASTGSCPIARQGAGEVSSSVS